MVVDTNVLVSGVFFSGPPYEILNAWRQCKIQMVYSIEILKEYIYVAQRLAEKFPETDIYPILGLIVLKGELNAAPPLEKRVCIDVHVDKFFACAISSDCPFIISGDKHLHQVSGFSGIGVISPRDYFDQYLAT